MITKDKTTTYWKGQPMIWTRPDGLHVDADVWAEARGISLKAATKEIAEEMGELLPHAIIHFEDRL
jgi:hypothetical protein